MIKRTPLFLALAIGISSAFGQPSERKFSGAKESAGRIQIQVSDGAYTLVPMNEKMVQTTFIPTGATPKNFSYGVTMTPSGVKVTLTETASGLTVKTGGIRIEVQKSPFTIQYYYGDSLLVSEGKGFAKTDSTQSMNLAIGASEILYGGGARVLGMNRRGNNLKLYNRAHYGYETRSELMNYTLPLFLSSKLYAVLFDNASIGTLDLDSKANNSVTYETIGGTMNYTVIAGDSWFDLTDQYTRLTGRQPLPPRWAFGNFSSRFGYHSQNEVLSTVDRFFKDSIPVDAAIIDIYWFGKGIFGDMGRLDWYRDSFPEPQKMIQTLTDRGVKTILVTEPFILTTSSRWQEAVDKKVLGTDTSGKPYTYDFYFGNTGLVDLYKPEAREWFWNIYKDLTNQGIGGWWGDLGEPEVHPAGLQHVNGSADEIHNAYGHSWVQLVYEGYQKEFPQTRPFILMRSGYAGSQRYGIIPWTGDVSRSWGGLTPQPEIALQMGMQGLAYMHSDLGGFAGDQVLDNELYIRWLQYGVFQPIYRPHAQESCAPEPVFRNDTTKAYARKAIELRYKLLPYIYTMAFENNQSGKPLMRPLFFAEPTHRTLLTYDKAYMWGDALLVSPIKAAGVKEQTVYLPKGSTWTDFYTGKVYEGGAEVTLPVTLNHIPVLVKGGAIIPMLKKVAATTKANLNSLEVHYYFAANDTTTYRLYSDDGTTPEAFEKGAYELVNITATATGKLLTVDFKPEVGKSYTAKDKTVELCLHSLTRQPKKVMVNGSVVKGWKWNAAKATITLTVSGQQATTVSVKL